MTTSTVAGASTSRKLRSGRKTGVAGLNPIGNVLLCQTQTVVLADSTATAKFSVLPGADIHGFTVDVNKAFGASALASLEISTPGQTNFFGTYGLSAAGRFSFTPLASAAANWYAVAATQEYQGGDIVQITCKVSAVTIEAGGSLSIRMTYSDN